MTSTAAPGSRPRRRAITIILALLAPLSAVVIAAPAPVGAAPVSQLSPDQAASVQAARTRKPVHVTADDTAYTQTVANPGGTFTLTVNQRPQRVRQGDRWVAPDATLRVTADGTVAPVATVGGLRLSGGGTGPLASFDDGSGHLLSLSLPVRLPTPTLSGATATYASVLPGVDLTVDATTDGGIGEVLIVRDATAAANPALAQLRLTTATTGLALRSDPTTGALTATDATTHRTGFAAPPPALWDSTGGTAAPDGSGARSTARGPADSARVTRIPTRTAGNVITLLPPAAALHGTGVTYPLYIDPYISPSANPDAYVQDNHPSQTAYNPSDYLRTGYDPWPDPNNGWVNGLTRSFVHYGIGGAVGKTVQEAHLQLTEKSSSDPSTANYYELDVSNTGSWNSGLTWNNQPGIGAITDKASIPGVPDGQSADYQVGVTDIVQNSVSAGATTLDMVLHMGDEQNKYKFKKWGVDPALAITYWSTPATPTNLAETNGTSTYACQSTPPGRWIPAATNNQIGLSYTASSPDAGYGLTANAYLSSPSGYTLTSTTITATGGADAVVLPAATLTDGSSYTWYAQTSNPVVASPHSDPCYFRYDATPPSAPAIASTAYPASGPTSVTPGGRANISLTATDGGPNPSGLAQFFYNLNGTSIDVGGGGKKTITIYSANGSVSGPVTSQVSVPLSALHWGTNTLWAQAVDAAGNVSQPVHYDFYVQQSAFGAYTPGTAGDLDGDNNPDLVTVDAAGNVRMFTHPDSVSVEPTGDTTSDPLQFGGRILLPHQQDSLWPGGTFAGALITHAGSFTGRNTDDLIMEQNGNLAIAANLYGDGSTFQLGRNIPKPACPACVNYNGSDWSSTNQMVAIPTAAAGPADLLTLEYVNNTATLWLYTPAGTGAATRFNPPVSISTDSASWQWTQQQLIAAGPLPGSGGTTLWSRNPQTGALILFHNVEAGIANPAAAAVTVASTGFNASTRPFITSIGRVDATGNLPLWAIDPARNLQVIPTNTTAAGATTIGAARALTGSGWGGHEITLGTAYAPYSNTGLVDDGTTANVSFDAGPAAGTSYSTQAMGAATLDNGAWITCPEDTCPAGVTPGNVINVKLTNGSYNFPFPAVSPGTPDNWLCTGQTVPAPFNPANAAAHYLTFLGAANTADPNGATGTATVTYTDGHTQQITITLSDWTLHGGTGTPATGNVSVATGQYRVNTATGQKDSTATHLFATAEVQLLDNGQQLVDGVTQIASITLPANLNMHIFGAAVS